MSHRATGPRLGLESLEPRLLLSATVTTGVSPTGQSTLVIDNGADLQVSVINGGHVTSTLHLGDLSSVRYKGEELLAPYSATSRYSHYEQGLSSSSNISYTIGQNNDWVLVTADDSTYGVIQYYAVHEGDNNLYMATYVEGGGEGRFLAYLNRNVFTNIEQPSDISNNVGTVEGSDVFYNADGTTGSKFYNDRRMIDNAYHGVTGTAGSNSVGAWMFMGNREHGDSGPFFKDIDFQTTGGATELYNILFSGHVNTEDHRFGLQGPYALQLNDGSTPVAPDYAWMADLNLQGWVPDSQRGSLSGVATGMTTGHETVIGLKNADAQYWAYADPTTGAFSITGVQAGTYTMTMYDQELEVATRTVTVEAQTNLAVDITNTYYTPAATWRIGEWDGTPDGFMNADKQWLMHPSDVRMSNWSGTPNFIVGRSSDADWPMAQFVDVNNGQRITFSLTAAQAATAQTLRIGITLGFEGGRNRITVNAGTANEWTSSIPGASHDFNERGVTRGTYRGFNQLYTYDIPASSLVAGTNTIDLPVVSGSSGTGFLSPNVVYDAIDLVPTSSLNNTPYVQSITLTPPSDRVDIGSQISFAVSALDQFGNPIAANFEYTTTEGTIDQQGLFVAPSESGFAVITATADGVSAQSSVVVIGPTPVVVTPATASENPTPNATVGLSTLGDDDGGEANLTYTWSVLGTPPGSVSFSANGTNAAKNTTATFGAEGAYDLRVTITDSDHHSTASDLTVIHSEYLLRYKADESSGATLSDSVGDNDASLTGSYSFVAGRSNNALDLTGGYATLPAGVVSTLNDFTISTWINWDGGGDWQRIFDFGDDANNYMFLTASAATGNPRFAIRTPSTGEQVVDSSVAIPTGVWTHVALTVSSDTATLYINGVQTGVNTGLTLDPADLGDTNANYLGKSQFPDPTLTGSIDDFRIYARALSSAEISQMLQQPGDLNGDGYVGLDDLQLILDNWNRTVRDNFSADVNGDNYIGLDDLQVVLDNWNAGTPPIAQQQTASQTQTLADPVGIAQDSVTDSSVYNAEATSLVTAAAAASSAVNTEFQWPAYSPNIAYDFNEDFGPLDPPTKTLPGVSGVAGVYADDWWSFVWGADKNPIVTDAAWVPMIKRFNEDFAYITDVMGWPRDKLSQNGYYSTVYLFGSGLSTDNASNTDPGGWMGTTVWNGEPWHNVLASYIPVSSFDPAYQDDFQTGAMIHEGIHAIFANMPGGYNSAWAQESFNVWLQGTMESLRSGSFSGMGGLSVGSQIAPFIPIESYSGWLQDGTFGGPAAQGVNKSNENGQVSTWREILGGYQYGEAFPHALEVILGPKSIPWMWNQDYSGYLLQDMALAPGGLGDAQARRVIQEYRGRQAFCDFAQWSHAFRQLLDNYWGVQVQEEGTNFDVDVEPWTMTSYVATTNNGGTLTPEARTLPGWSGANQVPLTVDPAATSVSVNFNPIGANMSCQLVYRDTDGVIHYSEPVSSGVASMQVSNVLNNVVVAVVCNTDYIYEGEQTRTAKFDYTLDIGAGITGTADIYTKWWDYNPDTYTITASAGANGAISPSGGVVVDNGAVQTFTFTPAPGYEVDQVFLNGYSVGSPSSYTLNPVLGNSHVSVTFRDVLAPSAPGSLIATPGNGSVNLDWTDNGEPDLDGYNVYRATTSDGDYTPIAYGISTSDFTDNHVINGTTYYYEVTAVDAQSNESGFSSAASVVAIDAIAPSAPTGLTASEAGHAAVIDWTDNTEPDLGTYTVYRSTTSGSGYAAIASGLSDSSYLDTSVVNGTAYYYAVTATDESLNQSVFSYEVTPTSVLFAHWDFNDPSLGAADGAVLPDSDGYNIWRAAALDKSGNGNDLETWDYPAAGFTWSSNSEDGDLSIKSAGDYPAAFTWSSKSSPTGQDVEQFTGTSFTVEALATVSGSGYYRTVLGRDGQNLGAADGGFAALYLGLDDANHARFMYVDENGKSVDLRSNTTYAADDNVFHHFGGTTDGSTVSLYVDGVLVAQAEGQNMAGLAKGTTSGSGYHAGGWSIGRGLYWGNHVDRWYGYIDSVSIAGTTLAPGAFVLSDEIAPGDPAPAAPTGLTAIAHDGAVDLDWADNTELDLNYYTVYRSTKPGVGFAPIRLGLTSSTYTDPSADNGTTYYYVVTASDTALGESDFSTSASAIPVDVTPPAAPTGLSATPGNGSVSLNWDDNSDPDFVSYTIYRSTTSGSGYVAIASGLTLSTFVDNGVANDTPYYYVVTASDTSALESLNSAQVSATPNGIGLVAHYKFDGDTTDSLANNDGMPTGGPTYVGGHSGQAINLDGADDYVTLPSGVADFKDITLTTWVKVDAYATWQRVFDFGTGTDNYMFLTTQYTGTSPDTQKLRFAIRTPGVGEQVIDSSVAIPVDTWVHVALVLDGSVGTLYLNGTQVGQNTGMTLDPASLGMTTQNYIGKSQFDDPYFNGSIDDFRIYARALSSTEISQMLQQPGDLNGDGYVGLDDLQLILDNWNRTIRDNFSADVNGDNYIGLDDLQVVLDNWNAGTPPIAQQQTASQTQTLAADVTEQPSETVATLTATPSAPPDTPDASNAQAAPIVPMNPALLMSLSATPRSAFIQDATTDLTPALGLWDGAANT